MKYILMMNGTKADFDWYATWPKQELRAHTAFMHAFNKELKDSGAFVAAEGLAFPNEARIVRAGGDGQPMTDGVFPEAKEFLAGYWIVDVEGPEEAYRLAARASGAPHPVRPGAAGALGNQPIEVRRVLAAPPDEWQ
ncbi:MAG TPA: YciI family protein [Bryobacteraceae bacterium]|nr:YciI family protein [Bryobacteraceae bacterium]